MRHRAYALSAGKRPASTVESGTRSGGESAPVPSDWPRKYPRYQAHSIGKMVGTIRRFRSSIPAHFHARIATLEVRAATVGEISPIPPLNWLFPFREHDVKVIAGSGSRCYYSSKAEHWASLRREEQGPWNQRRRQLAAMKSPASPWSVRFVS